MTIREQITNVVKALAEIPAVVELVREGESMRRTHVETALRLQLAKKQAHIERLQWRASKCGADVTKALRDVAKWRDKCHAAEVRAGEELAKTLRPNGEFGTWQETVDDLRNELGPARAIISEQKRQLESCSARIRELETQAEKHRNAPTATIADLWRPIAERRGRAAIVFGPAQHGGYGAFARLREGEYCSTNCTHFITWEPPR